MDFSISIHGHNYVGDECCRQFVLVTTLKLENVKCRHAIGTVQRCCLCQFMRLTPKLLIIGLLSLILEIRSVNYQKEVDNVNWKFSYAEKLFQNEYKCRDFSRIYI